jgi:hypothetical protein
MIEQVAKVSWIEIGQPLPTLLGSKPLGECRSRDFESVKNAVLFVMEELKCSNRHTALILTDGATLRPDGIEKIYAQIKKL